MKELEILRISTGSHGTYGVLKWRDKNTDNQAVPFAVSLEDAWIDNQRNISCIPHGRFWCEPVESPKFGNTFTVLNVPNRDLIRFHWGNLTDHTQGCILVAENFAKFGHRAGVGGSKLGFEEFLRTAPIQGFWVNIHWREAW